MNNFGKLTVFCISLSCLVLTGCPKKVKDKFLRTFFDGVPASEELPKAPTAQSKTKESEPAKKETKVIRQKEPLLFSHPPFSENQCDSCHDNKSSQKLTAQGKKLCFTCHDDFTKDKKIVHFPVSDGDCVACHDPHQAVQKSLLKKPILLICFTCHDEKDVRSNPVHEDQNVCVDCHNPHASNEEKLLR